MQLSDETVQDVIRALVSHLLNHLVIAQSLRQIAQLCRHMEDAPHDEIVALNWMQLHIAASD